MKSKSFLALLLALTFTCSSFALQACTRTEATTPPNDTGEIITPLPEENGNGNGNENENEESVPSVPSAPSAPQPDPTPTPTPNPVQKQSYIRCTGESVNLRAGAGTEYAVLGVAEKNTTYAVVGKTGSWYKTYYRGKTAYFYSAYAAVLTIEKSQNEEVESVIDEGYKLLGVPYVYGAVRLHDGKGKFLSGFTAQKFDCSSLIQYIFYKGADKLLQVNTRTQVLQGEKVKSGDLQRGDCLFFTNDSRKHLKGVERIGHVALYLGDNYILHTASDYARIEQISQSRWSYFIEARRFL